MPKIRINNAQIGTGHVSEIALSNQHNNGVADLEQFEVVDTYDMSQVRDSSTKNINVEYKEGDVVILTLQDDSTLIVSPQEADFIINHINMTGDRGVGSWLLKKFGLVRRAKKLASDLTADKLIDKIEEWRESALQRNEGLYRCGLKTHAAHTDANYVLTQDDIVSPFDDIDLSFALAESPASPKELSNNPDQPNLIFIHGTASSTTGSFAGLGLNENRDSYNELRQTYKEHIYTLEHRTFSNTPVTNAINLLKSVPKGATLHLISHSRGGIVGELLVRSSLDEPFDMKEVELYYAARQDQDLARRELAEIAELNTILKRKRPKVELFVRCACPIRGTSLLDQKMDISLNAIFNLVDTALTTLAPGVVSSAAEFIGMVLRGLASRSLNPAALPGIEAMSTTSPLLSFLNNREEVVDSRLAVISGDTKYSFGTGFKYNLATLFADLYYRHKNDWVVDTRNMFGGLRRAPQQSIYFLDQQPYVSHTSYFDRAESAKRIVSALKFGTPGWQMAPFKEISDSVYLGTDKAVREGGNKSGPVVYVLPGIMGTELHAKGNKIWADFSLVKGGISKIKKGAEGVEAKAPFRRYYSGLIDYLREQNDVISYGYDWRNPITEEAKLFATELANKLDELDAEKAITQKSRPIRIIAHSMGGLVARAVAFAAPHIWERLINSDGFRLVMLGTPNGGSHSIIRTLTGHNKFVKILAAIDLRHSNKQVVKMVSQFEGVSDLLPVGQDGFWFDDGNWSTMQSKASREKVISPPTKQLLENSAQFYSKIALHPLSELGAAGKVVYVAGKAERTPISVAYKNKKLEFGVTGEGDGSVPWSTGIPDGVNTWYADIEHGYLPARKRFFAAYQDLLNNGDTNLLSTEPIVSRSQAPLENMTEDQLDQVPTVEDLELIFSDSDATENLQPSTQEQQVTVRVVHGDLSFVKGTIAVGHYTGDTLVGPEKVIDMCLNNALSESRSLRTYPGPIASNKYFSSHDNRVTPHGALVVGLGRVGTLTSGGLKLSFANALIELLENRKFASNRRGRKLSTLLIGSSAGGLPIKDCINCLLQGVADANARLRDAIGPHAPFIESLDIVELYQDTAIEAQHALLETVETNKTNQEMFQVEPYLKIGQAGRRRVFRTPSDSWWRRLDISADDEREGAISFKLVDDSSGAQIIQHQYQADLVDHFIEKIVTTSYTNDKRSQTLFEILLPKSLKAHSFDERDLLLVVDEETAKLPWELIEDRAHQSDKPLGVRTGLVRQLAEESNYPESEYVTEDLITIIGNPKLPEDGKFTSLPGAAEEARQIDELFDNHRYTTNSSIEEDFEYVIQTLLNNDCKVLHIAAHGVSDISSLAPSEPEVICQLQQLTSTPALYRKHKAGVILSDGKFITVDEIRSLRKTPELVFINCCHLGQLGTEKDRDHNRVSPRYNEMAASMSRELIKSGVKVVIAAGWAVNDSAAKMFALAFYEQMLKGATFGSAVKHARGQAYFSNPSLNTWGAYQCYGDPAYRLRKPMKSSPSSSSQQGANYIAVHEATVDLDNFVSKVRSMHDKNSERLLRDIEWIRAGAKPWSNDPAFLSRLGLAYGEIGEFEQAITSIETALSIDDSLIANKVLDELCNFKVRHAANLALTDSNSRAKANKLLAEALDYYKVSIQLRPSSIKLNNYLGSAYKRKCLIGSKASRASSVDKMTTYYEQAHILTHDRVGEVDSYPALQWAMGYLVQAWRSSSRKSLTKAIRTKVESVLHDIRKQNPHKVAQGHNDFWSMVELGDIELVRMLLSNSRTLASTADNALQYYLREVGSKRQYQSVYDNVLFLYEMLKDTSAFPARAKEELELLLKELKKRV